MASATTHVEWIRENKGLEAAFNAACAQLRQQAADMDKLWQSRFLEVRQLQDGSRKLWPVTEEAVSRAYDLQDQDTGEPPQFLYCDVNGQLHPVSVGRQQRHEPDPDGPDEMPFNYASADLIANGQVVGTVQYTDH